MVDGEVVGGRVGRAARVEELAKAEDGVDRALAAVGGPGLVPGANLLAVERQEVPGGNVLLGRPFGQQRVREEQMVVFLERRARLLHDDARLGHKARIAAQALFVNIKRKKKKEEEKKRRKKRMKREETKIRRRKKKEER